ncbi:MAG TPA: hypothetical protein DCR93_01520 [Cytophagales bacterium]|nr:hypothetical protein [Cytophagales bacterium]HAP58233.1 hypothetical protein [Cytophagales bacterium]
MVGCVFAQVKTHWGFTVVPSLSAPTGFETFAEYPAEPLGWFPTLSFSIHYQLDFGNTGVSLSTGMGQLNNTSHFLQPYTGANGEILTSRVIGRTHSLVLPVEILYHVPFGYARLGGFVGPAYYYIAQNPWSGIPSLWHRPPLYTMVGGQVELGYRWEGRGIELGVQARGENLMDQLEILGPYRFVTNYSIGLAIRYMLNVSARRG